MWSIYLDVCCLNRPFDDWSQERIRLEGDSVLSIIERVRLGQWQLISSEAITLELEKMPNLGKKESIINLLDLATSHQDIDENVDNRSQELENLGFGLYDSFHLACAEAAMADIFLSTDDRLLKNARRHEKHLKVPVENPVIWLINIWQPE
ncbi:MAG: PIN domain-containing protein [Oscillatoriaceae cyanobacterium]